MQPPLAAMGSALANASANAKYPAWTDASLRRLAIDRYVIICIKTRHEDKTCEPHNQY